MAHYKAADSKREQFRRYLEKSGVLDTLTKACVAAGSRTRPESTVRWWKRSPSWAARQCELGQAEHLLSPDAWPRRRGALTPSWRLRNGGEA
ncbi:C-Myc-binding protein isoform X2 [Dryobates pubescens]|uniref:C-Myc-binding protein isoform X2 n=1 Tax=Dryobates pubescens TaxID=118200 RepID=UPI0023B9ABCC|nr:C-Myc-binding protein isoform X2 [Dryobates pubescens]